MKDIDLPTPKEQQEVKEYETPTETYNLTSNFTKNKRPKRKYVEIDTAILQLLKLNDTLPTETIAQKLGLNYRSALNHLKFLEFKAEVVSFRRGILETWVFWRIKR
jgi:predicted transcriptional regulator